MNASNLLDSVVLITRLETNSRYALDFADEGIRAIGLEHVSTQSLAGSNLQLDVYGRAP